MVRKLCNKAMHEKESHETKLGHAVAAAVEKKCYKYIIRNVLWRKREKPSSLCVALFKYEWEI